MKKVIVICAFITNWRDGAGNVHSSARVQLLSRGGDVDTAILPCHIYGFDPVAAVLDMLQERKLIPQRHEAEGWWEYGARTGIRLLSDQVWVGHKRDML